MVKTPPGSGSEPPRRLAHEELMQMPILRYDGPIQLCLTPADLEAALHAIRTEKVVGIDTETRPTFRPGNAHLPSLVQIATSRCVYLFQLKRLDCSETLRAVLENAGVIKTGVALSRDFHDLQLVFPFQAANVVDLGDIAKHIGLEQTGVRNLAGMFLRGRITKSAQTSNWAAANLTQKQLVYAATDAWVCRELYLIFERDGLLTAAAEARARKSREPRAQPPSKPH